MFHVCVARMFRDEILCFDEGSEKPRSAIAWNHSTVEQWQARLMLDHHIKRNRFASSASARSQVRISPNISAQLAGLQSTVFGRGMRSESLVEAKILIFVGGGGGGAHEGGD